LSIIADPDGNHSWTASEHVTIERYSNGFLVRHDGFLEFVPDSRILRARCAVEV
jgi:hypothetical protein